MTDAHNYPLRSFPPLAIRHLGVVPYGKALESMRHFSATRTAETADEIWLLQHPAVYTLGQAGRIEDLLEDTGIEIVRTERGGQITYHGLGQVIAYVLIDLGRRALKVREFVALLEDAMIATLARYRCHGVRRPGAPGVYIEQDGELRKIAALGLKIRNGCSFHGVSLNVSMDLAPFERINPCGYPGLKTVDLASLGMDVTLDEVARALAEDLTEVLVRKEPDVCAA